MPSGIAMANKAPAFWWKKPGLASRLLTPAAMAYGYFAQRNIENRIPSVVDLPVLCIGNFTLGGTGKTPVAIAFAQVARKCGYEPGIVSRGFGGTVHGVHMVDVTRDCARIVGDEPLLLAEHARVVVASDRYAAARMLKDTGCNIILMDDGFQSRRLYADYTLLVVDAIRGFGNRKIFPSGPLRAPLATQITYTDSILIIGDGVGVGQDCHVAHTKKPVYHAKLVPLANAQVAGRQFLAFAGIGHPQKFFESVKALGGIIKKEYVFADHYFFSESDIKNIAASAKAHKLTIATTAKDYVRLKTTRLSKKLEEIIVFDVHVTFEVEDCCVNLLTEMLARYRARPNLLSRSLIKNR
ncbi:MAG: tetraacyldisaccharide 4'-kinase [Candidatus Tokpelaia sp. JSC085]|nr:MAG: tetraacyldisaccharide 4'-kinase [Candidatus Tokpelaia sp. JSC085]